jgi:hypothetical protein
MRVGNDIGEGTGGRARLILAVIGYNIYTAIYCIPLDVSLQATAILYSLYSKTCPHQLLLYSSTAACILTPLIYLRSIKSFYILINLRSVQPFSHLCKSFKDLYILTNTCRSLKIITRHLPLPRREGGREGGREGANNVHNRRIGIGIYDATRHREAHPLIATLNH